MHLEEASFRTVGSSHKYAITSKQHTLLVLYGVYHLNFLYAFHHN